MIAIHQNKNLAGFTKDWIDYCESRKIEYKLVNGYSSNLINQIEGCDAFIMHTLHYDYRDLLSAKTILSAIEKKGIYVFPNHDTVWFYDDKIAEKYLIEAIGCSKYFVPTIVFYTAKEAKEWMQDIEYPIVTKLRGGGR